MRPLTYVLAALLSTVVACDTDDGSPVPSAAGAEATDEPSRIEWTGYAAGVRVEDDVTIWYPAIPVRMMPHWPDSHGVLGAPPADGAGWPVVLYSHGEATVPQDAVYLAEYLVSLGFVVVAPTHATEDLADRVGDLSAALDVVLELDRDPADDLAGRLVGNEVAAIGHDTGAIAVEMLVLHDERVDAAVSLATCDDGRGFDHLAEIGVPTLYVGGRDDTVCPFTSHGAPKAAATPGAEAMLVDDARHEDLILRYGSDPRVQELVALSTAVFLARKLDDRSDGI